MGHKINRKEDLFFGYFNSHQNEIYSYVMTLVPGFSDADDVFQETSSVLWRKFDQFQPGTDFAAWGCKIAYYIVLDYRRKKYANRIQYSSETLELLSQTYEISRGRQHLWIEKMNQCISKLSDNERSLLQFRYNMAWSVKEIAEKINMSISIVYKRLSKVHCFLSECIKRSVASEK